MSRLIKAWVIGVLIVSGLSLFKFINLAMYGEVNYINNLFALTIELAILMFVLFMSIYLAWLLIVSKKELDLSETAVETK